MKATLLLLLAVSFRLHAAIIPVDRVVDWTDVGMEDGIPSVLTIFCDVTSSIPGTNVIAVPDGVTDATSAIAAAIALCPSNQVVYLPAGDYKTTNSLNLRNGVVLRGAGQGLTRLIGGLIIRGSTAITDTHDVFSGGTKGSTNISISGGFAMPPERMEAGWILTVESDGPTNLVYRLGNEGLWPNPCFGQQIELLTVDASKTNLTFQPPLWSDVGPNPKVKRMYSASLGNSIRKAGVENLTLVHGISGSYAINMENAARCWVSSVEVTNFNVAGILMTRTFRCNVFGSYVHDSQMSGSGGGYAILLQSRSSKNLVENNIFDKISGAVLVDDGSSGNVVAYNYLESNKYYETNWLTGATINHHSAHPQFNLFEGNVIPSFVGDNIHGSSSHVTLFRNRLAGWLSDTIDRANIAVALNATNWYGNIVGNVLGTPDKHIAYEMGAGTSVTYSFSTNAIYGFGYWNGTLGSTDTNAVATVLRHGNYDTINAGIVWDGDIADQDIPNSLYLSEKPSWFGSLTWPPVDPLVPLLSTTNTLIPAQARFRGQPYAAPILPAERTIDWSFAAESKRQARTNWCNVRVSIPGTNIVAVADGTTDDGPAFRAAIALCPAGSAIYIPAGTYLWSSNTAGFTTGKGITLVGDGPESTIIKTRGGHSITVSVSTSLCSYTNWTSGFAKGASNITTIAAIPPIVGDMIVLDELNDTNYVTAQGNEGPYGAGGRVGTYPYGGANSPRGRPQIARITAKDQNTNITFYPPLTLAYSASLSPEVYWWVTISGARQADGFGMEGICFDGSDFVSRNMFMFAYTFAQRCWIYDCKFIKADRAAVRLYYTLDCSIERSTFEQAADVGATSYGVELESSSGASIVDNVFRQMVTPVVFGSSNTRAVVAYNYIYDTASTGWLYAWMYTHAVHNSMHLLEGNFSEGPGIYYDQIHGSGSHNVTFRNFTPGWTTTNTSNRRPITVEAWNLTNSFVGNVLGSPSYHTSYEESTNYPSATAGVYRLGYWTNVPENFDGRVLTSTLRHGNWDVVSNLVWDVSIADTNIPASLYLTEKPSWFGNLAWPAIGPDVATMTNMIPAKARFFGIDHTNTPSTNRTARATTTTVRTLTVQ